MSQVAAGVDALRRIQECAVVRERELAEVVRMPDQTKVITDAIAALRDQSGPAPARLKPAVDPEIQAEMNSRPLRDLVSPSVASAWLVQRERALFGQRSEILVRSAGTPRGMWTGRWHSVHLATASRR